MSTRALNHTSLNNANINICTHSLDKLCRELFGVYYYWFPRKLLCSTCCRRCDGEVLWGRCFQHTLKTKPTGVNMHCHCRTHVEHVPNRFGYTMMVKCDEGGVFNTHWKLNQLESMCTATTEYMSNMCQTCSAPQYLISNTHICQLKQFHYDICLMWFSAQNNNSVGRHWKREYVRLI